MERRATLLALNIDQLQHALGDLENNCSDYNISLSNDKIIKASTSLNIRLSGLSNDELIVLLTIIEARLFYDARNNATTKPCSTCGRHFDAPPRESFCSLRCKLQYYSRTDPETGCSLVRPRVLKWRGRQLYPHRVAWGLVHGEIGPDVGLTRTCGDTSCCNPDHLRLSTSSSGPIK